jgi:hypothetical protein
MSARTAGQPNERFAWLHLVLDLFHNHNNKENHRWKCIWTRKRWNFSLLKGMFDAFEQVERVLDEERRWGNDYRIVFSKGDGTFWSGVCYEPKGEGGEFEYPDHLTQVWPHTVSTIQYTTTPNGEK